MRAALDDNGLEPSRLVVEITESAIMEAGAARRSLRALKALGVRLAIDDFGTGFSSLAHLRRFPLDVIKIDRSFVAGLGDGQGSSIAGAIISLAHALGLRRSPRASRTTSSARRPGRSAAMSGRAFSSRADAGRRPDTPARRVELTPRPRGGRRLVGSLRAHARRRHAAPVRLDGGGHDPQWLKAEGDEVAPRRRARRDRDRQGHDDLRGRQRRHLHIVAAEGDTLPDRRGHRAHRRRRRGAGRRRRAGRGDAAGRGSGNGGRSEAPPAAAPAATAEPPAAAPEPEPRRGGGRALPERNGGRARPRRSRGGSPASRASTSPRCRARARRADREGRRRGGASGAAPQAAAPAAPAPARPRPRRRGAGGRAAGRAGRGGARRRPRLAETGTAKGDVSVQELTRTQQVIARRMAESKATVPEFTIATDVDMEGAVELRKQLKAAAEALTASCRPTTTWWSRRPRWPCASSPRNGSYKDGHFELYSRVNVGVAVAAQDALVVPTVFDADRKSLGEIARDTRPWPSACGPTPSRRPSSPAATFTVSNLGMFGVTEFSAVINPPQAAILAVGKMEPRAWSATARSSRATS